MIFSSLGCGSCFACSLDDGIAAFATRRRGGDTRRAGAAVCLALALPAAAPTRSQTIRALPCRPRPPHSLGAANRNAKLTERLLLVLLKIELKRQRRCRPRWPAARRAQTPPRAISPTRGPDRPAARFVLIDRGGGRLVLLLERGSGFFRLDSAAAVRTGRFGPQLEIGEHKAAALARGPARFLATKDRLRASMRRPGCSSARFWQRT